VQKALARHRLGRSAGQDVVAERNGAFRDQSLDAGAGQALGDLGQRLVEAQACVGGFQSQDDRRSDLFVDGVQGLSSSGRKAAMVLP